MTVVAFEAAEGVPDATGATLRVSQLHHLLLLPTRRPAGSLRLHLAGESVLLRHRWNRSSEMRAAHDPLPGRFGRVLVVEEDGVVVLVEVLAAEVVVAQLRPAAEIVSMGGSRWQRKKIRAAERHRGRRRRRRRELLRRHEDQHRVAREANHLYLQD